MPRYFKDVTIQVDEDSATAAEQRICDFLAGAFAQLEQEDPVNVPLINVQGNDAEVTLDDDQTELRR